MVGTLVSMERGCPYLFTGSKFRVNMTFNIDNLEGQQPPSFGEYVWENPQENKG